MRNTIQPSLQSAQSAQQQPRIEWRNAAADVQVFAVENAFDGRMRTGEHTTQRIAVAADIFGSRLHAQINTERYGLLKKWRAVTIVDQRNDMMLFGKCCYSLDVLQF